MNTYSFTLPVGGVAGDCIFAGVSAATIPQPDGFWLDFSLSYSTPKLMLAYAAQTLTAQQQSDFATLVATNPHPTNTPANNQATLTQNVANALIRLRQIQTQAQTFQAQIPYTVANLANLNDLLSKSQLIAATVNDIATDLIGIARILSGQFDGTN